MTYFNEVIDGPDTCNLISIAYFSKNSYTGQEVEISSSRSSEQQSLLLEPKRLGKLCPALPSSNEMPTLLL